MHFFLVCHSKCLQKLYLQYFHDKLIVFQIINLKKNATHHFEPILNIMSVDFKEEKSIKVIFNKNKNDNLYIHYRNCIVYHLLYI